MTTLSACREGSTPRGAGCDADAEEANDHHGPSRGLRDRAGDRRVDLTELPVDDVMVARRGAGAGAGGEAHKSGGRAERDPVSPAVRRSMARPKIAPVDVGRSSQALTTKHKYSVVNRTLIFM